MPSASPPPAAPSTRPSGWTRRGAGWPALAQQHLAAGIDRQVRHRDELARPRSRPTTTSFACARNADGSGVLACERAEDELRHRHVGRRVDAVARDVAEDDREPAVAELEEVVDVAADVDLRRRLVDRPDLEARGSAGRSRGSSDRCIVSANRLLLLVEPGVVDRERGLRARSVRAVGKRVGIDRRGRVEREDRQLGEQLGRRRDRQQCGRRALARGTARAARGRRRGVSRSQRREAVGVERARRPGCGRSRIVRTASLSRASATCTACGTNWSPRSSGTRITAASTPSTSTIVFVTAAASSPARGSARTSARSRRARSPAAPSGAPTRATARSASPSSVACSCSRAFWTATASCAASAESSATVALARAPDRPGTRRAGRSAPRGRAAAPRAPPACPAAASAARTRASGGSDPPALREHRRAGAQRAEDQLEQRSRDLLVPGRETACRPRRPAVLSCR